MESEELTKLLRIVCECSINLHFFRIGISDFSFKRTSLFYCLGHSPTKSVRSIPFLAENQQWLHILRQIRKAVLIFSLSLNKIFIINILSFCMNFLVIVTGFQSSSVIRYNGLFYTDLVAFFLRTFLIFFLCLDYVYLSRFAFYL